MIKRRLQGLVVGVLIGSMFASGLVFATVGMKDVQVAYNDIKILIDGQQCIPKDANGNEVEPFTLAGTTYLPVRAIANAFGKNVDWDSSTNTVILGSPTSTYLDQLGSFQFNSKSGASTYGSVSNGSGYTRGIEYSFSSNGNNWNNTQNFVSPEVVNDEYLVNKEYSKLKGTLLCRRENGGDMTILKIYGDNNLIYTSPSIKDSSSVPAQVDVKISGITKLRFEYTTTDPNQIDKQVIFADGVLLK